MELNISLNTLKRFQMERRRDFYQVINDYERLALSINVTFNIVYFSAISKELSIYLVAGSIPEVAKDSKLYNTSTIWGPEGNLLATYRKIHLFDIDIPGEITFKESDSLSAGNQFAVIDVKDFKVCIKDHFSLIENVDYASLRLALAFATTFGSRRLRRFTGRRAATC